MSDRDNGGDNRATPSRAALSGVGLAALGVVYGDIGTSPLYALRESFAGTGDVAVSVDNVLGVISLIAWSLVIVISVKYLMFVLRADNDGEGGILALTVLATPSDQARRVRRAALLVGLFGTALLYGDGMITPAISVLSAVEGVEVATPALASWVVPLAVVVLVGLFLVQRRGTASIGRVFGPVMVVWFATIATLGAAQVFAHPGVMRALNPVYAVTFFADNGFKGFLVLGSVFLVVTGGEALYADMGHFGVGPIRRGWFFIVFPALLANYFGQGALLIDNPAAVTNPFYELAPSWALIPLVILATAAAVIASQALISGVFSLTAQAVRLGYLPRIRILHTSDAEKGQIYVPAINWALMIACIALVVAFQTSNGLAAAYGVAVTTTMVITTGLLYLVLRERFGWSVTAAGGLCAGFLVIDTAFFVANIFKIPAGGWVPLVIGGAVFTAMTTWCTGRQIVAWRIRAGQIPLEQFINSLMAHPTPPRRVPGTAVFLFSIPATAPPALVANHRHNEILHEQVVIVSIRTTDRPRVLPGKRAEVTDYGNGVHHVILDYGYRETPDVPRGLNQGSAQRLGIDTDLASYFLGSESLVVTDQPGMVTWREKLFALMSRNAINAAQYFSLPANRTIIVGTRVEL